MEIVSDFLMYGLLFVSLYLEVFLLITYFELKDIEKEKDKEIKELSIFPSVTILVPVWNEQSTVIKTINSILSLNYPKDKLSLYIIDDGSTDNTWETIQEFKDHEQITILKKENGGKHTALNHALTFVKSDLVGCLDADSFVDQNALLKIVSKFEDTTLMAVTPSIKIQNPHGILGNLQKAEYIFGVFLRKVLAHLDAIYITPGPFSIFRREVFDIVGPYKKAHNTEDMEIAMRMQKHGMRIGNAHDAFVYTVAPTTLYKLYKQRLRWVYGFLKNAIDYRDMFFKPKHGNLGVMILPAAGFSVLSTMYFFGSTIWGFVHDSYLFIEKILTIGFHFNGFNFDLFYLNTDVIFFVSAIAVLGTVFIIVTARSLAEEKTKFGIDSALFMMLYTVVAPIWMSRAIYNVIFSRDTKWR